jgi:GT2 family glycosyltransferase
MSPTVGIVIVNFNGWEDSRRCLESLRALRTSGVFTILVDNDSEPDPTDQIRREFPWCTVIRNASNQGWAGGNNTGIHYALSRGAEQVILLNNDTTVSPELVSRLLSAAERHNGFGIIGPVINFLDEPDVVRTDGCIFNSPEHPGFFQRLAVPLRRTDPPPITEVDIVNGCCLMVSAEVFHRIGLMDPRFFLVHEEADFCLRARRAGFHCGVIGEALVWHKGSSSFRRTGQRLQRYYDARNLYLLLRKHQTHHRRGRSFWASRWEYLKYVYYRFTIEREHGHTGAASAVLEGFWDALTGQFGPFVSDSRPAVPILRSLFEWRRGGRQAQKERQGPSAWATAPNTPLRQTHLAEGMSSISAYRRGS